MPVGCYHFPNSFLWGTGSAAHQVEGGNTNSNWSLWEQEGHTPGLSDLACDWWGGRWREDFNRAADAGHNALRLSVEWSRIQPSPGRWDQTALDFYRTLLCELQKRRITPMVTLHHFTDPLWIADLGGWENQAVISYFIEFTRKIVEELHKFCSLWCTFNEPNVYALKGYVRCSFPPGTTNLKKSLLVQANMAHAHAAVYHLIHEIQPAAQVGYALHFRPQEALHPKSPLDQFLSRVRSQAINMAFPSAISTGIMRSPFGKVSLPETVHTQDFLGLNYYTRDAVSVDLRFARELFSRTSFPPGSDLSDSGINANIPEAFFQSMKFFTKTYPNLPIYVTENGIDDAVDRIRPRYLAQHIHAMWRAVNFNWPVKGYFHWALVDNFEWEHGWEHRYGLWQLDPETQERRKRPSADLYAAICRENGLSSALVEQYCPEVMESLFPGGERK